MSNDKTIYAMWSRRDSRDDLHCIYENLEDAKDAVDDNVPRSVFRDDVEEIERGVYSQYGYVELEFGWWVTRETTHTGGDNAGDDA